jgi:2,3-bisphosphoglycerate-dependent phosphoglycerate mutase
MKKLPNLILMRHGESVWNKENLFTGWVDVPLSNKGINEALKAGEALHGIPLDAVYTSTLSRCIHTTVLALTTAGGRIPYFLPEENDPKAEWSKIYSKKTEERLLPITRAWQLNERMYGELQGLNKDETREKFGKEQVEIWRRSFDVAPPGGESLKMTSERTLPYFDQEILPRINRGERILIVAHGNSLRSIMMELDRLSPEEVVSLEIPLGKPISYFKEGNALLR